MRYEWQPADVQPLRTVQLANERALILADMTGGWYLFSLEDGVQLGSAAPNRATLAGTLNRMEAAPTDLPTLPSGEPNPARWVASLDLYLSRHGA